MNDRRNDRKKLTTGPTSDDNQATLEAATADGSDPRIIALVEFLARRAAERDFGQLVSALNGADGPDGAGGFNDP